MRQPPKQSPIAAITADLAALHRASCLNGGTSVPPSRPSAWTTARAAPLAAQRPQAPDCNLLDSAPRPCTAQIRPNEHRNCLDSILSSPSKAQTRRRQGADKAQTRHHKAYKRRSEAQLAPLPAVRTAAAMKCDEHLEDAPVKRRAVAIAVDLAVEIRAEKPQHNRGSRRHDPSRRESCSLR